MKNRLTAALTATALAIPLAGAAVIVTAGPGSAHTPSASGTCQAVTGSGTAYEKGDTVTVYIDGAKVADDKAGNDGKLNASATPPQDGEIHGWKVVFDSKSNAYDRTYTGDVGPCGETTGVDKKIEFCHNGNVIDTSVFAFYQSGHVDHGTDIYPSGSFTKNGKTFSWPAQGDLSLIATGCQSAPDRETQTRDVTLPPNCEELTVTTEHQSRTQDAPTWDGKRWVPGAWGPWTVVSSDSRPATVQECPNPPLPEPQVETRPGAGEPVCYPDGGGTVPTWTEQRSREAHYEGRELVWGDWTDWTKVPESDSTRDATSEECPAGELPDAQTETRPAEGTPVCADGVVPTWTESRHREASWVDHEIVWGEWSEWEKVEDSDGTRDATTEECPQLPADEVETRDVPQSPVCTDEGGTVATYHDSRSRSAYYGEDNAVVWGEWSGWVTDSVTTRDATVEECPPTPTPTSTPTPTPPGSGGTPPAAAPPVKNPPMLAQTGSDTLLYGGLTGAALIALGVLGLAYAHRPRRGTRLG